MAWLMIIHAKNDYVLTYESLNLNDGELNLLNCVGDSGIYDYMQSNVM